MNGGVKFLAGLQSHSNYYGIMVADCKHTLVGTYLKPRPLIDRIRSNFKDTNSVKGVD